MTKNNDKKEQNGELKDPAEARDEAQQELIKRLAARIEDQERASLEAHLESSQETVADIQERLGIVPPPGEPSEVMAVGEVAAYLQLSPRTIYEMAHKNILPGAKIGTGGGGTWRFTKTSVDRWLNWLIAVRFSSSPTMNIEADNGEKMPWPNWLKDLLN